MQGIQAILDPDGKSVTLVSLNGLKPFKMKTKIKLMNQDASILQDQSQLDGSYVIGDIFNQNRNQQSSANN